MTDAAVEVIAEGGRGDLGAVAAALAVIADALRAGPADEAPVGPEHLLEALVQLRWAQAELTAIEPVLVAAARAAGVSWQSLASALGVASRQAAERRYLRSSLGEGGRAGATRDARVQAERDRRAGHRAVSRWANDNTADLRRLAGQVVALPDLGDAATETIGRLHEGLGSADAAALPGLLADTQPHLSGHPELSSQIEAVTERAAEVRERPARRDADQPVTGGAGEPLP